MTSGTWGLFAACAALIGTVLQVATSLSDVKVKYAAEIKKARFYLDLVRMRTDQEHRVILKVQAVLWGWISLMIAAGFSVVDQAVSL